MNTSAPLNPSTWVLGKLYSRRSPCVVITTISPSIASTFPASWPSLDLTFLCTIASQLTTASDNYCQVRIVHNEVFKNLVRTKKVSLMYIIVAKGARIAACQKSVELA